MFTTLFEAIVASLTAAVPALVLVALLAVPAAHWVSGGSRSVQRWLDIVATLPMVFPPTVIGFALLWAVGRHGPIGVLTLGLFGRSLVFTIVAAILAAAVVAFPLVYRSARAAFAGVDPRLKDAARTFGLGEVGVFWRVALPLARRGVASGLLLGFARALGEFGATLMVAGNIPGQTQTLPLAIYEAVQAGDGGLALLLCTVAAATGLIVLLVAERLSAEVCS